MAIPNALCLFHDQLLVSDLSAVVVPSPDSPAGPLFPSTGLLSGLQLSAKCVLQQCEPCGLHLSSCLFHVLLCRGHCYSQAEVPQCIVDCSVCKDGCGVCVCVCVCV